MEGMWMFTIKSFTLFCILKMFVIKSYRQKLWEMANSWKRREIVNYIEMNQQRRKKKTAKKLNENSPSKKKCWVQSEWALILKEKRSGAVRRQQSKEICRS